MSYEKFAPMTSALLARKGEAAPSLVAGQRVPREIEPRPRKDRIRTLKQVEVPAQSNKKASSKRRAKRSAPGLAAATKRRVVLTLTNEEFERVETAAAKRNVTRQQLSRDALFAYLSAITPEYGDEPCNAATDAGGCN